MMTCLEPSCGGTGVSWMDDRCSLMLMICLASPLPPPPLPRPRNDKAIKKVIKQVLPEVAGRTRNKLSLWSTPLMRDPSPGPGKPRARSEPILPCLAILMAPGKHANPVAAQSSSHPPHHPKALGPSTPQELRPQNPP